MSKASNPMPEGETDAQLAGEFASFFLSKIKKIRLQFQNIDEYIPEVNASVPRLHELQPLTGEEIEKEICNMNNKNLQARCNPYISDQGHASSTSQGHYSDCQHVTHNQYFSTTLENCHC